MKEDATQRSGDDAIRPDPARLQQPMLTVQTNQQLRLQFGANDVSPLRLGLVYTPPSVILEYRIVTHGLLAHHWMEVDLAAACDKPSGASGQAQLIAEWLCRKHAPWLLKVRVKQLERLAARLLLGRVGSPEIPTPRLSEAATGALSRCYPLPDAAAADLQQLFLPHGAAASTKAVPLPMEWLQSWGFEPLAAECCPYGLRQVDGGPCGIIAPVQAFLLRQLLLDGVEPSVAKPAECQAALKAAMTDVLWQCACNQSTATIEAHGKASFRTVKLLLPPSGDAATKALLTSARGCDVRECSSMEALRHAWDEPQVSASYFQEYDAAWDANPSATAGVRGAGVLLFLYSAALTHGCMELRAESDRSEEASLRGAHGYCTQEAVNLLLTGCGVPNVFDGDRHLGEEGSTGGPEDMHLRGIPRRCEVGFLTLFEAFGSLEVGRRLKDPVWPVWVVHAESHYSVLYSTLRDEDDTKVHSQLDVWYYDPLGRQDEEKRITITRDALDKPCDEDDLLSNGMIAKVIRTKWGKLADLDWNGADPIF